MPAFTINDVNIIKIKSEGIKVFAQYNIPFRAPTDAEDIFDIIPAGIKINVSRRKADFKILIFFK